jgi:hypothetical protein
MHIANASSVSRRILRRNLFGTRSKNQCRNLSETSIAERSYGRPRPARKPFPKNNTGKRYPRLPAASAASSSDKKDAWDDLDDEEEDNKQQALERKLGLLEERHYELAFKMARYRDVFFPSTSKRNNANNTPADWKQVTQFHHPPIGSHKLSYKTLQDSEESYRSICRVCNDLLSVTVSIKHESTLALKVEDSNHLQLISSSVDVVTAMLPFWANLRNERKLLVDYYRDSSTTRTTNNHTQQGVVPTTISPVANNGWMGWLQSLTSAGDNNEQTAEQLPSLPPVSVSSSTVQVTAHDDFDLQPGQNHYAKVAGYLYFNFVELNGLRNTTEDTAAQELPLLQERADRIQKLVDVSPQEFCNKKVISLLIRAHGNVGLLESAYRAEQALKKSHYQHGLLWYVLTAYLQVTEKEQASSHQAALAAKRVCSLLEMAWNDTIATAASSANGRTFPTDSISNRKELNNLFTIGFACLVNIPPESFDQNNNSNEEYYNQVDRLANARFGNQRLEQFWGDTFDQNSDLTFPIWFFVMQMTLLPNESNAPDDC